MNYVIKTCLNTLMSMVLCNQSAEKMEAAKTQIRESPREVKRYES